MTTIGDSREDAVGRERGLRAAAGEVDFELRAGASGSPLVALATAVLPAVLDPTLADLEWLLRGGMVVRMGEGLWNGGRTACTARRWRGRWRGVTA